MCLNLQRRVAFERHFMRYSLFIRSFLVVRLLLSTYASDHGGHAIPSLIDTIFLYARIQDTRTY